MAPNTLQALLILANIPFALVGGVLGLWFVGEYLSVPASVGFIALLGIAVLNGLVLVAHFNQLLATGMPMASVVEEGARRRLRPVLMTAALAALGLVPACLSRGIGSETQKPLAVVIVAGTLSACVLTLLLLPVMYQLFNTVQEKLRGRLPPRLLRTPDEEEELRRAS